MKEKIRQLTFLDSRIREDEVAKKLCVQGTRRE
jgi:hypothetical protein